MRLFRSSSFTRDRVALWSLELRPPQLVYRSDVSCLYYVLGEVFCIMFSLQSLAVHKLNNFSHKEQYHGNHHSWYPHGHSIHCHAQVAELKQAP